MRSRVVLCSARSHVARGHPPEFERRSPRGHDRVLGGERPQGPLVVGLDNRKSVRVVVREDRSEHNHVAALEVWAPVSRVSAHDLPL